MYLERTKEEEKKKEKGRRKQKKNFSQTYIHIHRWTLIINKKKKLVDKGLGSALLVRSAPHFLWSAH
jgi:thioredoxin-related protein